MKEEILNSINDPGALEKLYRSDKVLFRKSFSSLYHELEGTKLAEFWHERLNFEGESIHWGGSREFIIIISASLLAGLTAKLPYLFPINEDFYYPRNIGFIIFPALVAYFAWKNQLSTGKIAFVGASMLAGLIFINGLPDVESSDTLLLSCIHLLLFLWCLLGITFTRQMSSNIEHRLAFLKYNGDLVVITTLICIAGGITTALTIGLFSLIGYDIEEFYFQHIVVFGLPAAPVIGTFLTQTNPHLVGKVSPVIAKMFSPIALVMLVIYLVAMAFSDNDPYNDRDFLLIFNALLIGVMALIFFSIAESSWHAKSRVEVWTLFLLSVVTIVVNSIALSAIVFRISTWGITPNRSAVLGGNMIILIHLLMVAVQLYRSISKKSDLSMVGRITARYLPVYFLWFICVTFVFPFLFGFE
jgi:hypothetical protein